MPSPQNFTVSPSAQSDFPSDDEQWYTPPSSPVPMEERRARFPCTLVPLSNESAHQTGNAVPPELSRPQPTTANGGKRREAEPRVRREWNSAVPPEASRHAVNSERPQEQRSAFDFEHQRENVVRPEPFRPNASTSNNVQLLLNDNVPRQMAHSVPMDEHRPRFPCTLVVPKNESSRGQYVEQRSPVPPEPFRPHANGVQLLFSGNGVNGNRLAFPQQLEPHPHQLAHSVARLFPPAPPLLQMGKVVLTADLVEDTLATVRGDEKREGGLAEDMTLNTNYADLELPAGAKEIGDLLDLYVLAAENYPPGLSKTERKQFAPTRRKIAMAMLRIGLIRAACAKFVVDTSAGISANALTDEMIKQSGCAIELLLRAFLLMKDHDIVDDEVIHLWQFVETTVFNEFPANFWHTISFKYFESLCILAGKIAKKGNPENYRKAARALMNDEPQYQPARQRRNNNRVRFADDNHPSSP